MGSIQIDLLLCLNGANIAGDVEIVSFLGDLLHRDTLGVTVFFAAVLVSRDDFLDVVRFSSLPVPQTILAFAFFKVLGGVDEEDVVRLLALLEHQNANGDARGIKEIRREADYSID